MTWERGTGPEIRKCPKCGAAAAENEADCLACGINFAKWSARAAAPTAAARTIEQTPTAFGRPGPAIYLLIGAVAFGAYKVYQGTGRQTASTSEPEVSSAQSAAMSVPTAVSPAPPAPAPKPSLAGYDMVWQDYSTRLQSLGAGSVSDQEPKRFFQFGLEEISALSFDEMEAAGIATADEPMTPEEIQKGPSLRCAGPTGYTYPDNLPGSQGEYTQCWFRKSGRAKSSAYVQVIYSDIMQSNHWAPAAFRQDLGKWSVWTKDQILQGGERYIEKRYGLAAIEEERRKTDARLLDLQRKGAVAPHTAASILFEGYRGQFRREGALAGLDVLRQSAP